MRNSALTVLLTAGCALALTPTAVHVHHASPRVRASSPSLRGLRVVPDALYSRTYLALNTLDSAFVKPVVRVGNHAAALLSLWYFGLISTTMMTVRMPNMPMLSPLITAITKDVGATSNAAFSALFPTLVTPANFVFLIWPAIAALQLLTLAASIARPARGVAPGVLNRLAGPPMAQTDLTALALANSFAATWLLFASNAAAGRLPLGSLLTLPLVPLFAAAPLRSSRPPPLYRPLFQLFSSFTTIASFLALTIELQHGGRVALLAGRAEPCACIFAALCIGLVALPGQSSPRVLVTGLALTGILSRRVAPLLASGVSAASLGAVMPLLRSPSFVGLLVCWAWAATSAWRVVSQAVGSRVKRRTPSLSRAAPPKNDGPSFGERGVFF